MEQQLQLFSQWYLKREFPQSDQNMSTADRKMGACRTVLCPKQLSAGEGNYVLSHRDLNYLLFGFCSFT